VQVCDKGLFFNQITSLLCENISTHADRERAACKDLPTRNLVKALGKTLDHDAEKALCGLVSQPFEPPQQGHTVAVKIVTRTGAEMTTTVKLL